jgi:hypothetical protein
VTSAPDRFEVVAVVYDQPQLALLLSLFESERIWVIPTSYYHVAAQWNLTVALGGVQLRVLERDAAAARRLLSEIDPSLSPRRIFSDNRLVEILLILGLFLVGYFAPPARIPAHFLLEQSSAAKREK